MTAPDQIVDDRQRLVAALQQIANHPTFRMEGSGWECRGWGEDDTRREGGEYVRQKLGDIARKALASPSEGNKKGDDDALIRERRLRELLNDCANERDRYYDELVAARSALASRPQPRKATGEEVGAFLASYYGDGSDRDAIHQRTERALNAVFALSVSPAAAEGREAAIALDWASLIDLAAEIKVFPHAAIEPQRLTDQGRALLAKALRYFAAAPSSPAAPEQLR